MADKDKKKGKEKEKKEKEKEKEKDRDRKRTSSNAASEAPSFAAPAPQLSSNSSNDKIIKNERSAEGELFWRMWVQVGDFDALPVEVDASLTVHEVKKALVDNSELEISQYKPHKLKLSTKDGMMLDAGLALADQVDPKTRLVVLLPALETGDSSKGDSIAVGQLKKELDELRRQIGSLAFSRTTVNGMDFAPVAPPSMISASSNSGSSSLNSIDAIVRKNNVEILSKLKELETSLQTKTGGIDEALKQLSAVTTNLKRLGGLPDLTSNPYVTLLHTFSGHEGPVEGLAHGQELLYSCSTDMTVKVWDVKTLRYKSLLGHTDNVICLAATPDDKTVISGSDDRTIRMWDVPEMKVAHSFEDDNTPCCLRIARGHLFSGGFKCVKVWSLEKMKQVHILPNHNHWVRALTIGGGYLITGSHNTVKLFDMGNFILARTFTQNCGSIYAMITSGNMLYAGTYENTVLVWDLRTKEYVRSLAGHVGAVYALCLDQEGGTKLFSGAGSIDNSVRVWDLRTNKCLQRCTGHSSSVNSLAVIDDKLYSCSTDQTIRSWKILNDM